MIDLIAKEARARTDEIERARRLPPDLAAKMAEAGLFRMAVPKQYGGVECSAHELLSAFETMSSADSAVGWCLMIGATTGTTAAFMAPRYAEEIYRANPNGVTGGVFAPRGTARPVDGGHLVTGRWAFASGSQHCDWLSGGCLVEGSEDRRSNLLFFPASEVELIDTWVVSGLAGTGSLDMAVTEAFVPTGRGVVLGVDEPHVPGPLYVFPVFGLLAVGVAAVALGIARAAVDELVAMAGGKTPMGSARTLAHRSVVQTDVAKAEAALRAARMLFYGSVADAWDAAMGAAAIDDRLRVALRLAATHAVETSAAVVDAMYAAGGGTSIYATCPLQRHFRDVHAVTQHAVVAPATWELSGRVLLGLPTDTSVL